MRTWAYVTLENGRNMKNLNAPVCPSLALHKTNINTPGNITCYNVNTYGSSMYTVPRDFIW